MKKKMCITTLPPFYYGGIASMMSSIYNIAKHRYNPTLCYAVQGTFHRNRYLNQLLMPFYSSYRKEKVNEMDCIAIDKFVGVDHSMDYFDIKGIWRHILNEFDIFFSVGGSAHSALPLYSAGKKYSIWIATPFLDDRVDRRLKFTFWENVREFFSFPLAFEQEKKILKNAYQILALSQYTKNKLIDYYSIPAQKITIAPFPIDIDLFYPSYKKDYSTINILFMARFNDPRKNTKMLLKAFKLACQRNDKLHLYLVGEEPNSELVYTAQKLGIKDQVTFTKRVSGRELLDFYQRSHIFAIPSNQEGLCISGLEALACGLPIVSTKCGGPEEYVKDYKTGFLVEQNDEFEFAEKLDILINDLELLKKMSIESREEILHNYSREAIESIFLNAFEKLESQ